MKKLIGIVIALIIQQSTFNIQYSFAQAPNDNIGSGNCLDFDGVDDWVSLPNNVSNFGTGDFSIEFWYRSDPVTPGNTQAIIGNRNDACANGVFWHIHCNSTAVGFEINTVDTRPSLWVATNEIDDSQWHHVAFVRSGVDMRAYQDGELVMTRVTPPEDVSNSGICRIGVGDCSVYWPGGGRFLGQLDELRMWNIARIETEIKDNMCVPLQGNETGLVGYWRMNEGMGGTITDLTFNGNHGTLQ